MTNNQITLKAKILELKERLREKVDTMGAMQDRGKQMQHLQARSATRVSRCSIYKQGVVSTTKPIPVNRY